MAILKVKEDFSTIQAAVDAASPGDIILVEAGVYYEQVTVSTSNIRIIGSKDTVLDGKFRLGTGFILNQVIGVTIKSFKITHYASDGIYINGGSYHVIEKNEFLDNSYGGIEMVNAANMQITGNKIGGSGYYGVYNYQSKNARIEHNMILSCGSSGIYISSTDSDCDILYNTLALNYYGIICYGGGSRILCNKVKTSTNYGIYLYANVLVQENEILNNLSDGLYAYGQNNTVVKNKVSFNERNGVYLSGAYNTVNENLITQNQLYGLIITSTSNVVIHNKVTGNKVYDIYRLRPNNYLFDNICEKSNPPRLCKCAEPEHVDDCEPVETENFSNMEETF